MREIFNITQSNGFNERAQATIKAIRKVETMVKFRDMKPCMDIISDRESNEAFVSGSENNCVIYFKTQGNPDLLSAYNFLAQ